VGRAGPQVNQEVVMAAVATLPVETVEIASYKCDECGKIIAAPVDQPAPACCDHEMERIR
jgi:hypothetical protein